MTVSKSRLFTAGLCILLTSLSSAGLAKSRKDKARSEPPAASAPGGEASDAQTQAMAAALTPAQPVVLPMVQGDIGWIKLCRDGAPQDCRVDGVFALDKDVPATMTLSVSTAPGAAHPVSVLVPLELNLRAGFILTPEKGTGYVGTYSVCRLVGCAGDVSLPQEAYQALLKAQSFGLIVKNDSGRSIELRAPLEGFAEAVAGPAMTNEQALKARQEAGERLGAAMAARKAAKDTSQQQPANTAAPATVGAPPSASPDSKTSESAPASKTE